MKGRTRARSSSWQQCPATGNRQAIGARIGAAATDNIWQQIAHHFRKSEKKVAALAYVSTDRFLKFKKGDALVCDASDQAIRSGATSAVVLARFHKAGAELYSSEDLHAKVLVIGKSVLIGSCNLSTSSADYLREAAILTSDTSSRSQALALFHNLTETAIPIDATFLKRVSAIRVSKRRRSSRKKR